MAMVAKIEITVPLGPKGDVTARTLAVAAMSERLAKELPEELGCPATVAMTVKNQIVRGDG